MAIHIILSFDYELPLGGVAHSFTQSLFEPTAALLDTAKELSVPIVLFADVLSFLVFEKNGIESYTKNFKKQIQQSLQQGHDVQLHLHPHWLDSSVSESTLISSGNFLLADFEHRPYPNNIPGIIEKGKQALERIAQEIDPDYTCLAYRGGGYNLAPATANILQALQNNGILFDSSLSPGYFFASDRSVVDYQHTPRKKNWFLDPQGDFSKEGQNGILEIPIASMKKKLVEIPGCIKAPFVKHRGCEKRGETIHLPGRQAFRHRIKQLLSARMLSFDNHTYPLNYNNQILDHYIKNTEENEDIYLCTIGHPKVMGDYALKMLRHFVHTSRKKYGNKVQFSTYRNILDTLPIKKKK